MKNNFFFTGLLALLLSLTSCAKTNTGSNNEPPTSEEPTIVEPQDQEVENEVIPVSKFIEGSSENNVDANTAYNAEGGLKMPFDTAFPEYMNKAVYDETSILMKAKKQDVNTIVNQIKNYGISSCEFVSSVKDDIGWYELSLSETKSYEIINLLRRAETNALMFDLNYVLEEQSLSKVSNDNVLNAESSGTEVENIVPGASHNKFFKDQFYFKNLHLKEAYKFLSDKGCPEGGKGITVAVIDTGIDLNHEDLKNNIWVNKAEIPNNGIDDDENGYIDDTKGWNFVDENNKPFDDHGHGTHVAGIIAAENNDLGTLGIAYNAKVMALKAGDQSGSFTQSRIAKAIYYAYMNGADVINMSFGGDTCSIAVQDALIAAYTDCSLVAAAGNESYSTEGINARPIYPAAFNFVVGVMSQRDNENLSSFSNYDPVSYTSWEYEVSSWGEGIYSTIPNNKYMALSGTSMATPMVSAVIALLKTYYTDSNMYPSKFFMAQVAASSEKIADTTDTPTIPYAPGACILDAYTAFTRLPKPNVQFLNYYLFDRKEHSDVNNENGNLDSGETVYFAPVFINRWGKATDVNVSFDTKNDIAQTDSPYVSIENDSFSFGDIGTYSTKDYLILNDENTTYIGTNLSKSLKIIVFKDIPNAVNVNVNISFTYKNALNPDDNTIYEGKQTIKLYISNGVVLPSIIDTDMTLTNDKLWIIEEKTFISKKTTLTIEAGTTVQFGSTSTDRIYNSSYSSPSLFIYGNLIVNGELGNEVNFVTSEKEGNDSFLISTGGIDESKDTKILLRYLHVEGTLSTINLLNGKIEIDHCTFELQVRNHQIIVNNNRNIRNVGSIALKDVSNSKFRFNFVGSEIDTLLLNCYFINVSNSLIKTDKFVDVSASVNYYLRDLKNTSIVGYDLDINIEFVDYDPDLFVDSSTYYVNVSHLVSTPDFYYSLNEPTYYYPNNGYFSFSLYLDNLNIFKENIEIITKNIFEDFTKHNIDYLTFKDFKNNERKLVTNDYKIGGFELIYKAGKYFDVTGEELSLSAIKDILQLHYAEDEYGNKGFTEIEDLDNYLNTANIDFTFIRFDVSKNSDLIRIMEPDIGTSILTLFRYDINNAYYDECKENCEIINEIIKLHLNPFKNNSSNINLLVDNYNDIMITGTQKQSVFDYGDDFLNINTKDPYVADEIIFDGNDNPLYSKIGLIDETHQDNEKLWPYITKMELTNKDGEIQSVFGNEQMNVKLTFNRDMDTNAPIRVRFGSYSIAADYEIDGTFIGPRTWVGTYTINTLIESGTQYFNISGGHAAGDPRLTLDEPIGRFKFELDTSKALSQTISGVGTDEGILLNWFQDDYDLETVMGYNVYRAEERDGNYQKINSSVIPFDETSFLDENVMPGKSYWYTFTMVLTDFSETNPAGKINATAKDTMAPNIYHSPVYRGYTDNNLIITCTISDNIGVESAILYYRIKGSDTYKSIKMNQINDKYTAKIAASEITTDGLEYYIEASDGTNIITKGSITNPFEVIIKDSSLIENIGDVDGNGEINVKDAHMLLSAIYGEILLSDDQFIRADLNSDGVLSTVEALRILQYINGTVTSLQF